MRILAGDIGGTNARLAFLCPEDGEFEIQRIEIFPSTRYQSLLEIVKAFVRDGDRPISSACFGVAGPVVAGRVETSNLPWVVDSVHLAAELGLESVGLINDLEANAYGVSLLGEEDLAVLNAGSPDLCGNAAIISAGTGLGEAGLFRDGDRFRPFATEGGHTDFSPRNTLEIDMLRWLADRYGRVSWERVVSGPGLLNIYEFLRDTGRGEEPDWLPEKLRQGDPPAVISRTAIDEGTDLCVKALDMFVSAYGAEAGNVALKMLATGGVYLGGGIAPKILPKLHEPLFMEAFTTKGRLGSLMERVPVRVITNDRTALLGAALYARMQVKDSPAVPGR